MLEAERLGWAATGRNGGFCAASLTHGVGNGLARWPGEMPLLQRLGAANLDAIEATIRGRGIDCDFELTGELDVAIEPWQLKDLGSLHRTMRDLGEDVELLTAAQTRALVSSPTYLGGSWIDVGWQDRQGVGDGGNQFHYYRLTGDNRLVFGGYDALYYYGSDLSERRQRRPETEQLLYHHMLATFPGLRGIRITHTWGGAIDTSTRFSASWQRAFGQGRLGPGIHRFGRRRVTVRCTGLFGPVGRPGQRTHPAGDGATSTVALATGTVALVGDPDDKAQPRASRQTRRTARHLATVT